MKGGVAGQYESHSHFTVSNAHRHHHIRLVESRWKEKNFGCDLVQMPGLYRVIKVSCYTCCVFLYAFIMQVGLLLSHCSRTHLDVLPCPTTCRVLT